MAPRAAAALRLAPQAPQEARLSAPRLHVEGPLAAAAHLELPAPAARHAQVLRLQPGAPVVLFDGRGGEWLAHIVAMSRARVEVAVERHVAVERGAARAVTLAIGMPANERMDALVEKATELGVAAMQPLVCARSVLRLDAARAERRRAHWQGIAVAASEQSGRTRVPHIEPVLGFARWLASLGPADATGARVLLSPRAAASWSATVAGPSDRSLLVLSGPEGGLAPDEDDAAIRAGFVPVSLGPLVLRADTAPLAVLAWCALADAPSR
jgi:16S rRNA (uracil1498-N3)-methyltransferase